MAEISISEEEFGEPALNYWKPVPKPLPVTVPAFMPNYIRNPPKTFGWSIPPPYSQPTPLPPSYVYNQTSYPLTDVVHSYIQNQQIGLSPGGVTIEGERRRLSQCSQVSAEHLLYTLNTNPNLEQNSQLMTDSVIHDEVTRAAKTLFSKRNRTLLHWLNPDVNKNQIKIDVNAAWDSLPATEKVFYISQVLGKFAPHTTSLMVNPQLEPSKTESASVKNTKVENSTDEADPRLSKCSSDKKVKCKPKKSQSKSKSERSLKNVKLEIKSEDEGSCDSGLVMDVEAVDQQKDMEAQEERHRVKRKYTKRKSKECKSEKRVVNSSNSSCPLPVDVNNIKVEPQTEIVSSQNNPLPRVKRKYVKRKLVRKKYKKREPKNKLLINNPVFSEVTNSTEKVTDPVQNENEEMEVDLWIELGNDSILTNEEVDRFFDSIEDPDSLFRELGIIEN